MAALAAYDVEPVRIVPMRRGFNTTFRIDAAGGDRFVLRVQRRDGPDADMVRSEMACVGVDVELIGPKTEYVISDSASGDRKSTRLNSSHH